MPEYSAYGKPGGIDPKFRTLGFAAEVESTVILNAIEEEIDALMSILDSEARNKAVAESIIRRYASIEEIHTEMSEHMRRIDIKMMMMNDKMTGGFSGRQVLEATGEADQEAS